MAESITKQTIYLFHREQKDKHLNTTLINTQILIRLKITRLHTNLSVCFALFELIDDDLVKIRWPLRFLIPTIHTEKLTQFLINFAKYYLGKDIILLPFGIWTPQISSYHDDIDGVSTKLKAQNEKFKAQIKQLGHDTHKFGIIIINKDIFKLPGLESIGNTSDTFEIDLHELEKAQLLTLLYESLDVCWICRRPSKSEYEYESSSLDEVFSDMEINSETEL